MKGLYMKYFVLKPKGDDEYAKASRMAIREYAKCIELVDKRLAHDLRGWLRALTVWSKTDKNKQIAKEG